MIDRLLSFILIATLSACPLLCSTGQCGAGHCCADQRANLTEFDRESTCIRPAASECSTSSEAMTGCCSKSTNADGHDDCANDDQGLPKAPQPSDHPPKSCQGVCGGALLAKPIDSQNVRHLVSVESLCHCCEFVSLKSRRPGLSPITCPVTSSGNYGRFVRTLCMSFLC